MQVQFLNGVFLVYPWCNCGKVEAIEAREGNVTVHFSREVSNKKERDEAMGHARYAIVSKVQAKQWSELATEPCGRSDCCGERSVSGSGATKSVRRAATDRPLVRT